MLDPRILRRSPEAVANALKKRGFKLDLDKYRALEELRKQMQDETESLQNRRNVASKAIGIDRAAGKDIGSMVEELGHLKSRLDVVKDEFKGIQSELDAFFLEVPNIPDDSVPEGENESANLELRRWRSPPSFDFEAKDHVELAQGRIDLESAVKITGSRYAVMYGPLVRLHRALVHMMIDVHVKEHGYEEVYVPYIVNRDTMQGTGQLPKFEDDLFRLDEAADFYLVPTAEVPVTNIVKDSIVSEAKLPLKFVCHTPCFRRESGSAGRDTHGIIRQHQFEKVELVQIVKPETSWRVLEELAEHAEAVLQRLELPYRAVVLCGGDLGFSAAKTIDLEVWLPGSSCYREISSCSNFLDFQARRTRARYRDLETRRPTFMHTLNGSGLAVGRTLIAILENFQDKEGVIRLPTALHPYTGGMEVIESIAS